MTPTEAIASIRASQEAAYSPEPRCIDVLIDGYSHAYADGMQAASDYVATHSATTLIGGLSMQPHLMAEDARGKV